MSFGIIQLTMPILEIENVAPLKSLGEKVPLLPLFINLFSSLATSRTVRLSTFFITGTASPWSVAIARPMLWCFRYKMFSHFSSMEELITGYRWRALEAAFMKKGKNVILTSNSGSFFNSFLSSESLVTLISSLYTKCGIF